jgi:predicted GH43/DUF377 family glycosyl hydrolase
MYKLKRYGTGPIFSPDINLPWEKEGVFNPGIIKFNDGVYMLYRAVGERESYISRLGLAKSLDGLKFERASLNPVFEPKEIFDKWATEDPRITKIGEDYYISYVAVEDRIMEKGTDLKRFLPLETSTALLKTKDFVSYENLGVISPPNSDNKDIVLFPRLINGRYFMLHRPNYWSQEWFKGPYEKYVNEGLPCDVKDLPKVPAIWMASSLDLKNWVDHHVLISPYEPLNVKIGPGLPPIETDDGWLIIYHHITKNSDTGQMVYSVRAALLDIDNPYNLIAKIRYDILSPEKPYEMENGTQIVFPTGGFVTNDTLYVYYGASDRYVCLATGSLSELLKELKQTLNAEINHDVYEKNL